MNGALGLMEHALVEQAKKQIVELDPAAPVEAKVVEEVFRRFARVLDLRVGGQLIRTTVQLRSRSSAIGTNTFSTPTHRGCSR